PTASERSEHHGHMLLEVGQALEQHAAAGAKSGRRRMIAIIVALGHPRDSKHIPGVVLADRGGALSLRAYIPGQLALYADALDGRLACLHPARHLGRDIRGEYAADDDSMISTAANILDGVRKIS